MKKKSIYQRTLGWLIPSISEFEFVYFVSLIHASFIGYIFFKNQTLFQNIRVSVESDISFIIILAFIALISSWLIYLAIKSPRLGKIKVKTVRTQYVFIPAFMVAVLWLYGDLFSQNTDSTFFAEIAGTVIGLRYTLLLFIVRFEFNEERFRKNASQLLDDYQITYKGMWLAVLLGVIASVFVLNFNNLLIGIVVVYGLGQETIITLRRRFHRPVVHS